MDSIKYHVNKEKGVVVAVLKCDPHEVHDVFCNLLYKHFNQGAIALYGDKNVIDSRYVGIARCSENDKFDEEFGKKLALARAKVKKSYAIYNKFYNYVEVKDKISEIIENKADKLFGNYLKECNVYDDLLEEAYK